MYVNNKHTLYSYFTSPEEIKKSLYKLDLKEKVPFGGIPLFYDADYVYIDNTDTHTFIVGATGSKKTRLIGMPSLQLFARAGESFISSDPKGELYERTYPLLKEQGYKIIVINLREPKKSNGWNPFTVPYKLLKAGLRDRCIELVTDMANCMAQESYSREPYWSNSAVDLLTGLILIMLECAEEKEIHFKSLRALRTEAFKPDLSSKKNKSEYTPPFLRDKFLDHLDKSTFIFTLLNGTVDVGDITRGCILSELDQAMRPFFSQNNLIDMLSSSDFEMRKIGKTKTAVFLISPDENTLYHRLISVFVKQCYTELIYEAQKQPNKKLPVRVNFLLDEFSSLPTISDFPNMITASRSRNIRFHLFVQGIKQLEQRYDRNAETIRGNCENWIFLHSKEFSLLEELANLSGKRTCEEPLVSIPMLQTLDKEKGEAFIMHKRLHPFIANLFDIDQFEQVFHVKGKVQYPKNKHQADALFDFVKYCKSKDSYFLSQLFDGRKMTENEYYMSDEDEELEPIFTTSVPSEEELQEIFQNRISNKENEVYEDNGENIIQTHLEHALYDIFGYVEAGWSGLLLPVIKEIIEYNKENPDNEIIIDQVKEKFGQLRIYVSHAPYYIQKLIDKAGDESKYICETCGARGKTEKIDRWYKTLCEEHFKEWQEEKNKRNKE